MPKSKKEIFKVKDIDALAKDLKLAMKDISDAAKKVVEEYSKNPSEMSGSMIHFHENSPSLKE